ncbi:hypothetical protein AVEN_82531-1 [Araneus ventricosus]|uniref:Uncharacterized protein n=1 Tax=Araneus ventricosus TaxID=182803 RepID=A0A4Y2GN58_ARAVE|nr:hypothetical protein AVEN_82531-1 [Araneus ventricosus]
MKSTRTRAKNDVIVSRRSEPIILSDFLPQFYQGRKSLDLLVGDSKILLFLDIGNIPDWVEGQLFRLGPAKWDFDEDFSLNHWLDGSALMYKFTIRKGHVSETE